MAEIDKVELAEEMKTIQTRHPGWTYTIKKRPHFVIDVDVSKLLPDTQREVAKAIRELCASYELAIKLAFQGLVHVSDVTQTVSAMPSVISEPQREPITGNVTDVNTPSNLGQVFLPNKSPKPSQSGDDGISFAA